MYFRRPDGRFADSASTVSTAVLNHYSGYHRRPINRVSRTLQINVNYSNYTGIYYQFLKAIDYFQESFI